MPASLTSMGMGGASLVGDGSAVMLVPSVVVLAEFDMLINPGHPGGGRAEGFEVGLWWEGGERVIERRWCKGGIAPHAGYNEEGGG
jgi:hypothetical protein